MGGVVVSDQKREYYDVGGSYQPSQAKVLTEGGELCEAQVDIPLSVIHSCV